MICEYIEPDIELIANKHMSSTVDSIMITQNIRNVLSIKTMKELREHTMSDIEIAL